MLRYRAPQMQEFHVLSPATLPSSRATDERYLQEHCEEWRAVVCLPIMEYCRNKLDPVTKVVDGPGSVGARLADGVGRVKLAGSEVCWRSVQLHHWLITIVVCLTACRSKGSARLIVDCKYPCVLFGNVASHLCSRRYCSTLATAHTVCPARGVWVDRMHEGS